MIATCSAPSAPRACAVAVASHRGANGSPVIARRGPSAAAWSSRRVASLPLTRNAVVSTFFHDDSPNRHGSVSAVNRCNRRCSTEGSIQATVVSRDISATISRCVSSSTEADCNADTPARIASTALDTSPIDRTLVRRSDKTVSVCDGREPK